VDLLAINCGSSTLKAALIDAASGARRLSVLFDRIGQPVATLAIDDGTPEEVPLAGTTSVLERLDGLLASRSLAPDAVVHRVVHGGVKHTRPTLLDAAVVADIEALSALAPLHHPPAVAGLRAARGLWPGLPQVAVFDTAFHATLPRHAREYALPRALVERHDLRRYGFHGTSHSFVARQAACFLGRPLDELRLVTCHLGNGCSVAAIECGRSVDTSMGMTPLEGLPMGTRSGDLDPGMLLALMRVEGLSVEETEELLTRRSGFLGLAGSSDLREIEARAAAGDDAAHVAIQVFAHRLRKYIGAYAAVMGGIDAIVFTGGIGEHSVVVRHRVLARLDFLGARLNVDLNRDVRVDRGHRVATIAEPQARVQLLVVATDEELAMVEEAAALLGWRAGREA